MRIRLPPELEELRQHHDPMAPFGVPAHVDAALSVPAERRADAGRSAADRPPDAATSEPFDVRFERTGRVPGSGLAGARTRRTVRRP